MQAFLNTTGPFVPIPPRDRPVAVQDNRITDEAQRRAAINFFGPPAKRTRVTPTVTTTDNLQVASLFFSLFINHLSRLHICMMMRLLYGQLTYPVT